MTRDYQQLLGDRLRAIRQQKEMTLQDVEEASSGRWKAVVVGAYERADRSISAAKLAELARFYSVPVAEFLPETTPADDRGVSNNRARSAVLDLTRLTDTSKSTPTLQPIVRMAATIQRQRGDYNGRVLTLRGDDLRVVAAVYGVTPEDLVTRLEREGVLVTG